jgi:hypothetical protein
VSPICNEKDTTRLGGSRSGELRLTDPVLASPLDYLQILAVAAVEYYGGRWISYDQFERILPARRRNIINALNTAAACGWISKSKPTRRKHSKKYEACYYGLAPAANHRSGERYTRLRLDIPLDSSASRWIVRAAMEKEQGRAGMIRIPNEVLARRVGVSPKAIILARENWKTRGQLEVVEEGRRSSPGTYVLTDSPYTDTSKFDPDKYAFHSVTTPEVSLRMWATEEQLEAVLRNLHRFDPSALASLPPIIEANDIFALPKTDLPEAVWTDFDFEAAEDLFVLPGTLGNGPIRPPRDTDTNLYLSLQGLDPEQPPESPSTSDASHEDVVEVEAPLDLPEDTPIPASGAKAAGNEDQRYPAKLLPDLAAQLKVSFGDLHQAAWEALPLILSKWVETLANDADYENELSAFGTRLFCSIEEAAATDADLVEALWRTLPAARDA